jgi:superfamily II DNA helicase RecQ
VQHIVDELVEHLLRYDISAAAYHSGRTPAHRSRTQKKFMIGKLRVVVATVAFGMGLDKRDIDGVVHFNMPRSIEAYVQVGMNRCYCCFFLSLSMILCVCAFVGGWTSWT